MLDKIHRTVKLLFYLLAVYIKHFFLVFIFSIQIIDYKLALEGPVAYVDHYDVADPLSCKALFQKLPYEKRLPHLNIYVIVQWRELIHMGPSLSIPSYINYRARLFHLLKLSHIFPVNTNVSHFSYINNLEIYSIIMPLNSVCFQFAISDSMSKHVRV